jgi:hypothetical protein
VKPLTPEAIARIREEWQEEIRNEKPKTINYNRRNPTWVSSQLDDLTGMTIAEQMKALGCSQRTIHKLRHDHPYYVAHRKEDK